MAKLKDWQFTGTKEPLKLVEMEIPKAKEGYTVEKVQTADYVIQT